MTRWLACVVACVVLAAAAAAASPRQDVVVIDAAQVTLAATGRDAATTPARLPYSWDREVGAVEGVARFALVLPAGAGEGPQALFVPRTGNSFRLVLNGQELAHVGAFPSDPYADTTQQPRFIEVPPSLLGAHNVLEITIGASRARGAGLSPVVFGPREAVHQRFAALRLWQVSGSRLVAIVSAVLGALALLLWLRRREPVFLYYGLGELFWSIQTARVLFDHPPLPWPWWGIIVTAAFHAAPALLCKFALTVVGRERGAVGRAMDLLAILALPATVAWLQFGVLWIGPAGQTVSALAGLAMAVVVVRATWRSRLLEERVLCAAVVLIVACGLRDVLVLRLSHHAFEVVPWVRFAWLGFGMSMAWVIAERMRKDSLALARMNEHLQQELARRSADLEAAFAREREAEKRSGALQERQRMVRDLHDGLGSHLVSALRSAQQGRTTPEEMAGQLREAVDRLRITVDALHDAEGDISAALAAVRYRLAPRLKDAGIELHWDVDPLPGAPGWGVRESHHLQMLLYEAFGNMMAHSRARSAALTARAPAAAGEVHIELRDDGAGFEPDVARQGAGKGLANMRQRAAALGGRLDIRSDGGGTRLVLALPLAPR
jgi:hypothetical protein